MIPDCTGWMDAYERMMEAADKVIEDAKEAEE